AFCLSGCPAGPGLVRQPKAEYDTFRLQGAMVANRFLACSRLAPPPVNPLLCARCWVRVCCVAGERSCVSPVPASPRCIDLLGVGGVPSTPPIQPGGAS